MRELSTEDRRLLGKAGVKIPSGRDVVRQLGPAYPEMGTSVAKWRRVAAVAGSISAMSKADRHAYGSAVENAIRAKQRLALVGPAAVLEGPPIAVGAALRAKHEAALSACPSLERRKRSPEKWEAMYAIVMAEKRAGAPLNADGRKRAVRDAKVEDRARVVNAVADGLREKIAAFGQPAAKLNPAQKAWVTRRAKAAAREVV